MIAIICPTRARPKLFKRMVDSVRATAHDADAIRIYAGIREKDRVNYEENCFGNTYKQFLMPDGMPTVHKWNIMAQEAVADGASIVMLAGDDMVFSTPFWDKAIVDHYKSLENKIHIYSFQDSRDKDGTPHPIATKEYIQKMGYFLPPIFLHWYIDTWTVDIAKHNNCFTHLRDYQLLHDKPCDQGIADDTHNFIRENGWLNSDMWTNLKCKHFLAAEKERLLK